MNDLDLCKQQTKSDVAFLYWKMHWLSCTVCHGLCYPWEHRFWCSEGKRLWHTSVIENNRANRMRAKIAWLEAALIKEGTLEN